MRSIVFFLLIFLSARIAAAQQSKVDSLLEQLPRAPDKGLIYKYLVYELGDVDNPRAYQFCLKYYDLRMQAGDTAEIVHAGRVLGQLLRRLEKFDSSKIVFLKMLPIARRHNMNEERIYLLNALSVAYSMGAQYDKALSCLMECLRTPELHNEPSVEASVYHHMGFNYYKLSNYDKGIEYSEKALALKKKNNISRLYDNIQLNISLCYMHKGELKEARKNIDDVLTRATPEKTDILMEVEFTLGEFSLRSGDTLVAREHFTRSMQYAKERGDLRFELDNINVLCELHLKKQEIAVVGDYLDRAQKLINGIAYKREIISIYRRISAFNKLKGNYKDALLYQEKANELHESVYGSKTTNNVLLLESEYVEFENASRIAEQTQLISLKDDVIRWQYITIGAFVLILTLVLIILYGVHRNHKQKKLANAALEGIVKERTVGFANSISELQQWIKTNDERSKKLLQEISHAMNAIGVLCYLTNEDTENKTHYISDIKNLSQQVTDSLASFQSQTENKPVTSSSKD